MKLDNEEIEQLKSDHKIIFTEKNDYVSPNKPRCYAIKINSSSFFEYYTQDCFSNSGFDIYYSRLTGKGFDIFGSSSEYSYFNCNHFTTNRAMQLYGNEWTDGGKIFKLCLGVANEKGSSGLPLKDPVVIFEPYVFKILPASIRFYGEVEPNQKKDKYYYNLCVTINLSENVFKEIYSKLRSKCLFDITFIITLDSLFYSYDCSQNGAEKLCDPYGDPIFIPWSIIHKDTQNDSLPDDYYGKVYGALLKIEIVEKLNS